MPLGKPIAFLATSDPVRARRFFEVSLGLTFVSEDDFALVFETGETELRIQIVPSHHPQPFTALGWNAPDIEAEVDRLAKHGVDFVRFEGMEQDDRAIWSAPGGARIAWFRDPDGNVLSLTSRR